MNNVAGDAGGNFQLYQGSYPKKNYLVACEYYKNLC